MLHRIRRALWGDRRHVDLPHQVERRRQRLMGEQQARSDRVLMGVERLVLEAQRAERVLDGS